MLNEEPKSYDEWLKLSADYRKSAELLMSGGGLNGPVWNLAGFALECVIKAAIHKSERLNRWPENLKIHDLSKLMSRLGVVVDARHPIAAEWAVVLQWRRQQMYNPAEFSDMTILSLLEAAFGENGVEKWIVQNFLETS